MLTGKTNVVTGFAFLALFMLYGFVLIFLRDFAPGKEQWIADYAVGTHLNCGLRMFTATCSRSSILRSVSPCRAPRTPGPGAGYPRWHCSGC